MRLLKRIDRIRFRPKGKIRRFGFMNPRNRIHESDLLIQRHHDSDSKLLIRIHNLRRGFVSFWNERYMIWGHEWRYVSSGGAGDATDRFLRLFTKE
ncbi:hypothetical protein AVEN_206426-1 [Araneus ventricosus]|uniref:Uncharacterized protein n=1 Tax=Araneus ventricosus TaxID=182803 RepID=A0A4Y2NSJ1_ARAVE|nr:hypothetical protein AVEN_206426-1 [Araneus ventricosus]